MFDSEIILKVGKPIQTEDVHSLEDHLVNEVELFCKKEKKFNV